MSTVWKPTDKEKRIGKRAKNRALRLRAPKSVNHQDTQASGPGLGLPLVVGSGTGEFVQTVEKKNGKHFKRHYKTKYVEYHIGRGGFYSPEVLMRNYLDDKLKTAMDSTKQPGQVREWKETAEEKAAIEARLLGK